jgi:pantothenate kinase
MSKPLTVAEQKEIRDYLSVVNPNEVFISTDKDGYWIIATHSGIMHPRTLLDFIHAGIHGGQHGGNIIRKKKKS